MDENSLNQWLDEWWIRNASNEEIPGLGYLSQELKEDAISAGLIKLYEDCWHFTREGSDYVAYRGLKSNGNIGPFLMPSPQAPHGSVKRVTLEEHFKRLVQNAHDRLRKMRSRRAATHISRDEFVGHQEIPTEEYSPEQKADFNTRLEGLTTEEDQLFKLKYVDGMTVQQISKTLNTSARSLHRRLKDLKDKLTSNDEGT